METKKVKEYAVYQESNFYSFLTEEDFKLRKKLAIKRILLGKENSKKMGKELIQLFDLNEDYFSKASEETIFKIKEKAKQLILSGADLTVATNDFIYQGDFMVPCYSALDFVWYDTRFQDIKNLLLRSGADLYTRYPKNILFWHDHGNFNNKTLEDDIETSSYLKKLIKSSICSIDARLIHNLEQHFDRRIPTILIEAAYRGRFQCIKLLCSLGANPFYRDIACSISTNYHSHKKTMHYDTSVKRNTALETAILQKNMLIQFLQSETDEKRKLSEMKELFVMEKIIALLKEYETSWKQQGKFIPEEYDNPSFICSIIDKKNSELKKQDVNRTIYQVKKLPIKVHTQEEQER